VVGEGALFFCFSHITFRADIA